MVFDERLILFFAFWNPVNKIVLIKRETPMKYLRTIFILFVLLGLLAALAAPVLAAPGDTTRVSVSSSGVEGGNRSLDPSISADGRYVAFYSYAVLTAGDLNWASDVFVRDTVANTTACVSLDLSGIPGNSHSYLPSISADGRYVSFSSRANNLVAGDTNGRYDIFVRDIVTNTTTRVSVDSSGAEGNGESFASSISADGRYVAFYSHSNNLVAGDANAAPDIFLRDTVANITTSVSVDLSGAQGSGNHPSISADGRYVAFDSNSINLVAGDTNAKSDIFVRDTVANVTTRVSVDSSGAQANSDSYDSFISADGRYVAFPSAATNLVAGDTNGVVDIFVRDLLTNTTTRVSVDSGGAEGDNSSYLASLSADGRYVAFESYASNLAGEDTNSNNDIFVRDTFANTTARVSIDSSGAQGNGNSYHPFVSADGRFVAFWSDATYLVAGDTNGYSDVFLHETDAPIGILLFSPLDGAVLHYNRPTFDWADYPGATGYEIQVAANTEFKPTALKKTVTGSSYTPTKDLGASTLYHWRVRAKMGSEYSDWSQVRFFMSANPPSIPILTAPGNNKLVEGPYPFFDWKDSTVPVGGVFDHYYLEFAHDSTFGATRFADASTPVSQFTGVLSLNGGATYYWHVRAVAVNGDCSAWSKTNAVRIKYEAPTLLTPADTSTVGSLLPTFTWNTTPSITGYTIQVSTSTLFKPTVINKNVSVPTYTATKSLLAGATYYWHVRVNGPYGPSAWSATFSFTTP
jgi:Tol biopolymer transport system component